MRRLFLALVAVTLLACCTSTRHFTFTGDFDPPATGALILIVEPDIQLAVVTAGGVHEPREDWSSAARRNVGDHLAALLRDSSYATARYSIESASGRIGQIVRLHGEVGRSILYFHYGGVSIPTKQNEFEWTLGPGVQEIAAATGARYALFVTGQGSFASGGRVAVAIGMAILGVGVPLGEQRMFASLVDLQTGNVLWFNVADAGPSADIREPEGAASLVRSLMRTSPLIQRDRR